VTDHDDRGTAVADANLDATALSSLIDGEQRLLELFDARQARADAKLAAAATGALALPAATLALASPLAIHAGQLKVAYAIVVGLVILVFSAQLWNGGKLRRRDRARKVADATSGTKRHSEVADATPGTSNPNGRISEIRRRWTLSTESADAQEARRAWQNLEPTADPLIVQSCALKLWRTRAIDSREIAHGKEKVAAMAGFVFALALAATVLLGFWGLP
jgi:hypothetical protein